MKRLYVSAYEALDKIVGFTTKSKKDSLSQMIDETLDNLPAMVQEHYALLKKETESMDGLPDQEMRHCPLTIARQAAITLSHGIPLLDYVLPSA